MTSSIRTGQQISIGGNVATIMQHVVPLRQIQLSTEAGINTVISEDEFAEFFKSGDLKFINLNSEKVKKDDPHLLLQRMTEDEREEVRRRKEYVDAATTEKGLWNTDDQERNEAINEVARKRGDNKVPSLSSIRRWHNRLKANQFNLAALIPQHYMKGNSKQITEGMAHAIDKAIHEYCLGKGYKAKYVHENLLPNVVKELGLNAEKVPTYNTFRRRLTEVPEYVKYRKRHGHCSAQSAYPGGRNFERAKTKLERVEIDHTPLDVIIVDKDGKELGRPFATFIICCATRMILGFFISMEPVNRRNVLKAYIHSVLPKTYVKNKYKDIKNEWPCFGLYGELISDNGKDLVAQDVRDALFAMGVDYKQSKKRMPHLKGTIERFMRTINESLLHQVPGTTASSYQKKTEQQAKQDACLTFEELEHLIHKWVIDCYHMEVHRSLNDTPLNVWKKNGTVLEPPLLPDSYESLAWLLMEKKDRKLQKNGVSIFQLTYQSEDLANLARRIGYGRTVTVYYNPDNLSTLTVIDPTTEEHIKAKCTFSEYANGEINLKEHNVRRKLIREHMLKVQRANESDLREARLAIMEKVIAAQERNKQLKKRKSSRHKMDPERLQNSGMVRGLEKVASPKVARKIKDDPTLREIVLDFEPYESA